MNTAKRVALLGVLTSQALVLSIVESLIPIPVAIPGIKLGLANIVTVLVIIFFGGGEALTVTLIRCILSSVFSGGGLMIFLFSISGGMLSTLFMVLIYKIGGNKFSIIGVSIVGATAHNIGQLLMAILFMGTLFVVNLLPILLISGCVMGFITGITSNLLVKILKKTKIL
ncbi:MAG: Gx transporter family protein [Clostridium sp.]|nr:Gx transporter family protein [Clostridium sp.]